MKLSYSTLACPAWDIGKIIDAAVASRYDAIDFRGYLDCIEVVDSPYFKDGALREIARRVADAGLEVSCLSAGAKATAADGAVRAAQLDMMRRYADLCGAFGCRQVRIFGGDDKGIADPVSNAAETLVAAAPIARAAGIEFAIETHDCWRDTAKIRAAFDAAGRPEGISLLWDVHHPWEVGREDPEYSVRNLHPYIGNTHWKDSVPKEGGGRSHRIPGKGDVPLREIFFALRNSGYDGWFTLEWEKRWQPDIAEPEEVIPAFAVFIRNLDREWKIASGGNGKGERQ